jgi:hypothetical protein
LVSSATTSDLNWVYFLYLNYKQRRINSK